MKRDLQQHDIRTNLLFEFNVTGIHAANELVSEMWNALSDLKAKGLSVHLVGYSLKKPTCGFEIVKSDEMFNYVQSDTTITDESHLSETSDNDEEVTSMNEEVQDD